MPWSRKEIARKRVRAGIKESAHRWEWERTREREHAVEEESMREKGEHAPGQPCSRAPPLLLLARAASTPACTRRFHPTLALAPPLLSPSLSILCSRAATAPTHQQEKEDACRPSARESSLLSARERMPPLLILVCVVAACRPCPCPPLYAPLPLLVSFFLTRSISTAVLL
jgi:hypothetical protein